MQYILTPPAKSVDCTISLPASKSISNRALIINALAHGSGREVIHPDNLSHCDDTDVMVAALQNMPYVINIKACGTAMRFMTAYLSITEGKHILTGTERMTRRPIHVLVDALRTLGAQIDYVAEEGYPPLRIKGGMMDGGRLEIAGNVSSQYISALLMIAPAMKNGLTLHLTGNIISRPYIDLTVCTMREFGAEVEWEDANTIVVGAKPYESRTFTIENDWSASSYWYEIMALTARQTDGTGTIHLPGLVDGSRQGDSAVRYIYSMLGVKTEFTDKDQQPPAVTLTAHHRGLPRLDFDFINQPDLAQAVVVTTALLGIPFCFTGLQTLRIKETDRIAALKTEMAKLGYTLDDSQEGTLSWDGTRTAVTTDGLAIDTYEDHRMAMAFAPACIMFPGLRINDPQVVTKSYPHFWDDLRKAGFNVVGNSKE